MYLQIKVLVNASVQYQLNTNYLSIIAKFLFASQSNQN